MFTVWTTNGCRRPNLVKLLSPLSILFPHPSSLIPIPHPFLPLCPSLSFPSVLPTPLFPLFLLFQASYLLPAPLPPPTPLLCFPQPCLGTSCTLCHVTQACSLLRAEESRLQASACALEHDIQNLGDNIVHESSDGYEASIVGGRSRWRQRPTKVRVGEGGVGQKEAIYRVPPLPPTS